MEYIKHVMELGDTLIELLSEALGLKADYLKAMECTNGHNTVCGHYYPPCPQPELTTGISKHSDSTFITILLQDQIGGLQILHGDEWVDVGPIAGGLVVNIGDFLQVNECCWLRYLFNLFITTNEYASYILKNISIEILRC